MKLVTNRDVRVSSTKGHTVHFKKGEPCDVPDIILNECLAVGAIPADGEALPEEEVVVATPAPEGAARQDSILTAMRVMQARNDRGDFTAAGLPNTKVLMKETGFEVKANEIPALWDMVVQAGND